MALATVRAFGGRTRRPALRNGFLNLGAIDLPCPFFFLILPISIIQGAKHPENTWPLNPEYPLRMLRPTIAITTQSPITIVKWENRVNLAGRPNGTGIIILQDGDGNVNGGDGRLGDGMADGGDDGDGDGRGEASGNGIRGSKARNFPDASPLV